MKKYKKISKIIGLVLFALVFYFAGYMVGHQNLIFEKNFRPKITGQELYKPRDVDFSIFWDAWNKIADQYPGNFDSQKMIYGAVSGMVDAVGDPYSYFLKPSDNKNFLEELSGKIEGIGAEIALKDKKLIIISPLSGSPAEKAGLEPSDQIIKINNESVEGLQVDDAISKIRGQAGSKITLNVLREGWSEPKDFEITRAVIEIKSVEWEKKGDIAYIQISQFGEDTDMLIGRAAREIDAQKPKAIILDLRSNPGGYLESAVKTSGIFLDKGLVAVKEKNKSGAVLEDKTTDDPILGKYPVYVLINGGSASAAEIVAGCLQDYGKAKLIGEKTFGKGSVQSLEELKDGSSLRLTIAKWLTPKDRAIDKVGILPDIKIELTEEDAKAGRDPQLDMAMELADNENRR